MWRYGHRKSPAGAGPKAIFSARYFLRASLDYLSILLLGECLERRRADVAEGAEGNIGRMAATARPSLPAPVPRAEYGVSRRWGS